MLRSCQQVPKRKPGPRESSANSKPAAQPKKFVSFSVKDSRAIEAGFQKLVAEEDATVSRERTSSGPDTSEAKEGDVTNKPDASADETGSTSDPDKNLKIPVNEDYLFDVSIQERELAPAYWLGPVYEVRRGTWFYQGEPPPRITMGMSSLTNRVSQKVQRYDHVTKI